MPINIIPLKLGVKIDKRMKEVLIRKAVLMQDVLRGYRGLTSGRTDLINFASG